MLITFLLLKQEEKNIHKRILGAQTKNKITKEEAFAWEQILLERPDYKYGWIKLASYYIKLGDLEKAKEAINKAKNLDPLDETIGLLENVIENFDNF